jgi:hypothetical protein
MKHPRPINLLTQDEVRQMEWWAERRDADGHLIATLSLWHGNLSDLMSFITETKDGETVTVFGMTDRHRAMRDALVSLGLIDTCTEEP